MSLPTVHNTIPGVRPMRRATVLLVTVLAVCAGVMAESASALAAPMLRLASSTPEYIAPSRIQAFLVFMEVQDVGDAPLSGNLTFKVTLPEHVTAELEPAYTPRAGLQPPTCEQVGQVYECVQGAAGVPVGGQVRIKLIGKVEPGAEGALPGHIEVSGGGAAAPVGKPFTLHAEPAGSFAVSSFGIGLLDGLGAPVTQAGGDPAEQTTDFSFVSEARANLGLQVPNLLVSAPPESGRDVVVHVPVGFVGNPTATARCKPSQLATPILGTQIPQCPLASQIGVLELFLEGSPVPLYNIEPPPGVPAEFGFNYQSVVVMLQAKLRPSDYGVDVVTAKTPSTLPFYGVKATLWGSPSDPSHDPLRGRCMQGGFGNDGENCTLQTSERSTAPFLRLPTSCTGEPLHWGMEADTYQHPGSWVANSTTTPAAGGCERVPFDPNYALLPTAPAPHSASGADVTLSIPQDADPGGVASADFKSVSVTLPAGVSLDPSSANGLQACTDAQLRFKEEGPAECPAASKVGFLTIKSQFLDHAIGGSVYVLSQKSQDPASGELFRIAIEVRSDSDGVDIKLPGKIEIDPSTGQITTVFEGLPQLPFESMTLHFEGAAHPVLVTPDACGTYDTSAVLTGWNGKVVHQSAPFTIDQECGAQGFAPGFTAGAQNPVADAFTQFALQVTRTDDDQEIASLSPVTLPPGLLANIGSVPRCSDAQVAAAACPQASRLGSVTVGAGAGATPLYSAGSNVSLTGPYKGAPFGLAFLVHVQAGPYDLGMVVVRAALDIDPHTAQASVRTDPLPTIVKGVRVRLRDIRVSIDRPNFMINPTSCNTLQVTGAATSTQGATAPLASRFQVGECARLAFKPGFKAVTSAHASRRDGASLTVRVSYPKSGRQANIRSVKVTLPRQLASRLTTLQQACTDAQFAANPAACPAASRVGTATAVSPILASPLTGPAYFVSHGGAKFPELVIVLQGEGVTIQLAGETFIDEKTNITTSTFRTVPDAPVSTFVLTLPSGPHSALGTVSNLCRAKLVMPTTITAQNGRVLRQQTKIAVSGCAKHKVKRHAGARHKRRK